VKKIKDWIPAILMMIIIFTLSSLSGPTVESVGLNRGKLQISAHFVLFMFLTIAFYKPTKSIPLSIILTVLYAVTDEIHQLFTFMRSASISDIYVDSLGSLISGVFLWKLLPILPKKLRNWLEN